MTDKTPQVLITEAENKAADWQMAKAMADMGCPPINWNKDHPCEFGVFKFRDGYAVAPLFPAVLADASMRCLYRTDHA
jgi:hypothetical protein